jgi:hypothetical protein
MFERLTDLVSRARIKAATEMSFAAHSAGRWYARRAGRLDGDEIARGRAEHLRARGYVSIPADDRLRSFIANVYPAMARAWTALDRTWRDPPTGGTYKVFLHDVCERWPTVLELLDGETAAMLHAYYGSHFQFSYVEPYRTFPAQGELAKSWLWHRDMVPPGVLKLMVYLNGAHGDTGALRVLDRASTEAVHRLGFSSRADSDHFASELDNRHIVLDGEPGTAVIIDNTVLHKATAPERGHRDVVCFQILPSLVPEHAARRKARVSRSYAPATPQYPFLPRIY